MNVSYTVEGLELATIQVRQGPPGIKSEDARPNASVPAIYFLWRQIGLQKTPLFASDEQLAEAAE